MFLVQQSNCFHAPRRISPMPSMCRSCVKLCPSAPWPRTGSCSSWLPSWIQTKPWGTPAGAWTPSRTSCSSSSNAPPPAEQKRRRWRDGSKGTVSGHPPPPPPPPPISSVFWGRGGGNNEGFWSRGGEDETLPPCPQTASACFLPTRHRHRGRGGRGCILRSVTLLLLPVTQMFICLNVNRFISASVEQIVDAESAEVSWFTVFWKLVVCDQRRRQSRTGNRSGCQVGVPRGPKLQQLSESSEILGV